MGYMRNSIYATNPGDYTIKTYRVQVGGVPCQTTPE
jgi:hypothetical protein